MHMHTYTYIYALYGIASPISTCQRDPTFISSSEHCTRQVGVMCAPYDTFLILIKAAWDVRQAGVTACQHKQTFMLSTYSDKLTVSWFELVNYISYRKVREKVYKARQGPLNSLRGAAAVNHGCWRLLSLLRCAHSYKTQREMVVQYIQYSCRCTAWHSEELFDTKALPCKDFHDATTESNCCT